MPELPEVETVRRGLESELKGVSIKEVKVLRAASIGSAPASRFCSGLKGKSFVSFKRRGKYLLLGLGQDSPEKDEALLAAHLRMSGRLLVMDENEPEPEHVRVRISLANKQKLIFDDTRVFGRLWYLSSDRELERVLPGLQKLGPEPFESELNHEILHARLKGKSAAIKTVLLDQSIIAGIGNIYADESLFMAGIDPRNPAGTLSKAELAVLCQKIIEVIASAIRLGGSTLRDYTDSRGVNGNYQLEAHVYGRKGEACHACNCKIERVKLGGRSTHYCPRCQKLKKSKK